MCSAVSETGMPPRQAFDLPVQYRLIRPALPAVYPQSPIGTGPTQQIRRWDMPLVQSNRQRPAADQGSQSVLRAPRFVQEQLGHQPLEAIDLELQLPTRAIVIDLVRCVVLSPTIISRRGDALFTTEVRDCQSLWPDRGRLPRNNRGLISIPSPGVPPKLL